MQRMKGILDRFEHLIFRVLRDEQHIYKHISLVHPESKLLYCHPSNKLYVMTGRGSWILHMYPSWSQVPAGLLDSKEQFQCEDPRYNVIVTPQKIRQVPAIVPPQRVLTAEGKETGVVVLTGCLRDEHYY